MPASVSFAILMIGFALSEDDGDRELAARIKNGDHDAFREFFERYRHNVLGYLLRMGIDPENARDLLQTAFVKIWENRHDIDENKSLRSFLFRIAYTRSLNAIRDAARTNTSSQPDFEAIPSRQDSHSPEQLQIREVFEQSVRDLPKKRRLTFELCFVQGLTYKEAATAMGVSVKTIENQMVHALKFVRGKMEIFRDRKNP